MELVKVADGSRLWGEQYQRKFSDVLGVRRKSRNRYRKLRLRLTGEEQKRLTKVYTDNDAAYQLYLKAVITGIGGHRECKQEHQYFQQATDKDPNYALAYAGLADSYSLLGSPIGGISPREAFPKAKAAALKALELDDTVAEAYASLALVRLRYDWDWLAAERASKRAIELNPNYSQAHQIYGDYLRVMGRQDEAIAEIKRAQELEPLSLIPTRLWEFQFYFAHQYDQAIEQCQKTLELDPNFPAASIFLAWAYVQKARYQAHRCCVEEGGAAFSERRAICIDPWARLCSVGSERRGDEDPGPTEGSIAPTLHLAA
jgi:tetratricopeptide (TPR) repeat protein